MNIEPARDTDTAAPVSLPMYDFPGLRHATDALWAAIAERLKTAGLADVPAALTRSGDYMAAWSDPKLLFSQACGYPLMKAFADRLQVVAAPIYKMPGCDGAGHSSLFIVNAKSHYRSLSDLRGAICALNGFDSNTGMNLLRGAIAPLAKAQPFFQSVCVTGSHYKSLIAVAEGHADIAAIDCISFAYLQRFETALTHRVTAIGESIRVPAPPFVTSIRTEAGTLSILRNVLADVASAKELQSVRTELGLGGFKWTEFSSYKSLLRIEDEAVALGYPILR